MASSSSFHDVSNFSTPSSSRTLKTSGRSTPTRRQLVEDRLCGVRGAGDGVSRDDAVIGDGLQRLLRHRVDGVRRDQLGDVHRVGVVGVLHTGRGPQGTLYARAFVLERTEPVALFEHLLIGGVGQPGVRDAGLAAERERFVAADLLQPGVDLGVHPRHEERGDGVDPGQVVTRVLRRPKAVEVGVHDGAVPFDGEDQGDVHRDALRDHRGDRGQAGQRRRDLDEQVGPVDDLPQFDRLQDRLVRVVGQTGVDLDGNPTVEPVAGFVRLGQHVTRVADVVGGDRADGGVDVGVTFGQFAHLRVVGRAL